jgi:hypothetical protein
LVRGCCISRKIAGLSDALRGLFEHAE